MADSKWQMEDGQGQIAGGRGGKWRAAVDGSAWACEGIWVMHVPDVRQAGAEGKANAQRTSAMRRAALFVGALGIALNAEAQTVTILHTFSNSATNGNQSYAGLVQGSDGNFYGTTEIGGSAGVGTVFRISPSGAYTNLYSFASTFTGDGWQPLAGLVQGSDGNFYGTTSAEGTNACQ